mgnify:CR=1 FL=1
MDMKLYDLNDMVKAGCRDCQGCCDCCCGMGQSIVSYLEMIQEQYRIFIDPYPVILLHRFADFLRVRIGQGCCDCCCGMGQSIVLDPYDIWQLETNLKETFAGLLKEKLELHVTGGQQTAHSHAKKYSYFFHHQIPLFNRSANCP